MNLEEGAIVAGRFRLVRVLGQGGMGAVWLAQDTSLDTPCAIKFIHGEAAESAQMRSRFEREAKSAAQLRSPNVVQILDHGISGGTPYIAMEFLEGEDLGQRLQRLGRLTPYQTVAIISQVAKALTKANAAGLVHRDLKPANIFLVRDEEQDLAKVLDFGVAKSNMPDLGDAKTNTGALLGTPFYMSPEQARGLKTLDHRSDLWALAVIVFQCVTGRLPFLSDSLGDLIFQIGTDPIPLPSSVAADLPPAFDTWWYRAAMRDPAQRFQSAREFIDALTQAFGLVPSGGISASALGPGPGGIAGLSSNDSGNFRAQGAGSPITPGIGMPPPRGPWPSSPEMPPAGSGSPNIAYPQIVAPQPSVQTGVSSHSIAEKPALRRGGTGLLAIAAGAVVVAGAIAVIGVLVYVRMFSGASPQAASSNNPAAVISEPPTAASRASEAPVPPPVVSVSPAVSATGAPSIAASVPERIPAPSKQSWPDGGIKAVIKGKDGGASPARAHVPDDGF